MRKAKVVSVDSYSLCKLPTLDCFCVTGVLMGIQERLCGCIVPPQITIQVVQLARDTFIRFSIYLAVCQTSILL